MFYAGTNIRLSQEVLKKITPEYLYNALVHPKPQFESQIRNLRLSRELNNEQYAALKKRLPFFVCASFNPPFRKTENFAYTEYFIIDIDHVGEKGLIMSDLKARICSDPRTMMCFISPGEDGLKVVMKLSQRCYDAGVYSVFYKKFVAVFGEQYGLEQVIDTCTSDVTRVCFMSVDSQAYYNPRCQTIDMGKIIDLNDTSNLLLQKKELNSNFVAPVAAGSDHKVDPAEEDMARIKEVLKFRSSNKSDVRKDVFVPKELNDIEEDIESYLCELGFASVVVTDISYGKKFNAVIGLKKSEVNLFYGKKGFSVVISPKSGTDATLNSLLCESIKSFIEKE